MSLDGYARGPGHANPYEADVLATPCPRCGSPEGRKCRNPETGKDAHCPCVVRLKPSTGGDAA